MSLKVVVFNSPPRGGKGVGASHMKEVINGQEGNLAAFHMEFKDELFKLAANTVRVDMEDFMEDYDSQVRDVNGFNQSWARQFSSVDMDTWWKDVPLYKVADLFLSTRQLLIHVSEKVIKPSFGNDAFGKAMVSQLPENGVVFVSDSGFSEELQPVINHVGADNVLVIRLHRDGCTFEGDSRDYLTPEMFEGTVKIRDIYNNGTLDEFKFEVEALVGLWLEDKA